MQEAVIITILLVYVIGGIAGSGITLVLGIRDIKKGEVLWERGEILLSAGILVLSFILSWYMVMVHIREIKHGR